jgi:hypothetical protein
MKKGKLGPQPAPPVASSLSSARESLTSRGGKRGEYRAIAKKGTQPGRSGAQERYTRTRREGKPA